MSERLRLAAHRERFEKFLVRAEPTGCLLWTGSTRGGYGRFGIDGVVLQASLVAFIMGGGEMTDDQPYILHHCDRPACCEFTHLWAGTSADNMKDMASKKRGCVSRKGLPYGTREGRNGRFRAQVTIDGKKLHLGCFAEASEANAIAKETRAARFEVPRE